MQMHHGHDDDFRLKRCIDQTKGKPPQAISTNASAQELPTVGIFFDQSEANSDVRGKFGTKTGR